MKSSDLMAKAAIASSSAKALLERGDVDGACNRAYYALFDAARAALISNHYEVGKSHSGVIAAFGKHFVATGRVSYDLGRLLSQAEASRIVADYYGASVEEPKVREIVDRLDMFLAAVRNL